MGGFAGLFGFSLEGVLTGGIRTALPFIISGVSGGLSANEIQRTLTAANLGVRRTDLLNVVKVLRTEAGFPPYLRGTSGTAYPSPTLFRSALWPTKRNFTYVWKVTGVNSQTGQPLEQYLAVSSDSILTTDDAFANVQDLTDLMTVEQYGSVFDVGQPLNYELDRVLTSPYDLPTA